MSVTVAININVYYFLTSYRFIRRLRRRCSLRRLRRLRRSREYCVSRCSIFASFLQLCLASALSFTSSAVCWWQWSKVTTSGIVMTCAIIDACRTHVWFVPVECVTFVRFNRYDFMSLYDPLETFGELSGFVVEGVFISHYYLLLSTYQPST